MVGHKFAYDEHAFLLDGEPFHIHSGELHYFRIPREYWRDRLLKARALGLNTVCTYMPWNLHEPKPGVFDFSGMLDVAEFLRLAQELGLWVMLRPGPYICAEWDFGGLPAWLLAQEGIHIRCSDQRYLAAVGRYLSRVGDELAALQCTRGGPVLMVQVENEYGSYGNDKGYLRELRDMLRDAGFHVPLFTSDDSKPHRLRAGALEDCLATVNFGTDPAQHVAHLRSLRPEGPAMCAEFWCGWFDTWGKPRQTTSSPEQCAADVRWMVEHGVSFNLYMLHGGTNFGFTSGANSHEEYVPTVTSYDYRAPLDEAGRPTAKYWAIREVLAERQPAGAVLPDVPPPPAVIEIPPIEFTESVSLFNALPPRVADTQPKPMEIYGQASGAVLYRTSIAGHGGGTLRLVRAADYALVFLNGKKLGTVDRRLKEDSIEVPTHYNGAGTLDILVDAMGRVNFGPRALDRKGITQRVELEHFTLMDWQVFPLPLDADFVAGLPFAARDSSGPAFHRARFELDQVGDTFLDLRAWRKGAVWVNGRNLGRFWHVGPQQTLYCPGAWLRRGENEIVVFDLESDGRRPVAGLAEPVLDELAVADSR